MPLDAKEIGLRLFIDGVECPVLGAEATFREGGSADAAISVIANDQIWGLKPRALIQLFVKSDYDYELKPRGSQNRRPLGPKDPRRWKLLFHGELAHVSFSKTPRQRTATISAVDPLNYLDYIRQHFFNFRSGGIEAFENAFLGVNLRRQKFFDVSTKGVQSTLYTWLSQSTIDGQPSLYLGLQRAIREMFFASNDFYGRQFNRHRLGDLIVGVPRDTTSSRLYKLQFFEKFIKNQLSAGGNFVSATDLVNLLLGMVFHTKTTVPFPMFDPEGEARGLPANKLTDQEKAQYGDVENLILKRDAFPNATLNYHIIKPDSWFLTPPACNVIFPNQYTNLSFDRNYLAEPTRLFLRSELLFTGRSKWLTERFYAPDFTELESLIENQGSWTERSAKVLMQHERFTGPNPVEHWEHELSAYVQKGSRREYLSYVADYIFWRQRFAQRSASIRGTLNMNIVPGWPALVLDSVGTAGSLHRHVLGNVAAVRHSISQSGSSTTINLSAARMHDERSDFDDSGKSIEEVVTRGTDGWLDPRYDTENIGRDVYQPLFGITSIVDRVAADDDLVIQNTNGLVRTPEVDGDLTYGAYAEAEGRLTASIAVLQDLYRRVERSGGDMGQFVANFTERPKATLPDMNGLASNELEQTGSVIVEELLSSGVPREGFMSVAVDPDASDHRNDSYEYVERRRVRTGTKTVSRPIFKSTRIPPTSQNPQFRIEVGTIVYENGKLFARTRTRNPDSGLWELVDAPLTDEEAKTNPSYASNYKALLEELGREEETPNLTIELDNVVQIQVGEALVEEPTYRVDETVKTIKYNLKTDLIERRKAVLEYARSLQDRGIRG